MSAFHSSEHRRPVAVLRFPTQRQYTVRSCDLSQWSRDELQAEVAVGVRVMWDGSQHWIVAKDVCALIGKRVGSVGRAIYAFSRREKARMIVEQQQQLVDTSDDTVCAGPPQPAAQSIGRPLVQVMSVLSESGVKRLLSRTRSDRALEVQQFVDRALPALNHDQRVAGHTETHTQRTAASTEAGSTRASMRNKRRRSGRRPQEGHERHTALPTRSKSHKGSGSEYDPLQRGAEEPHNPPTERSAPHSTSGSSANGSSSASRGSGSAGGCMAVAEDTSELVNAPLPQWHSADTSPFNRVTSSQQQQQQQRQQTGNSGSSSPPSGHSALSRPTAPPLADRRGSTQFRPIVLLHSLPFSSTGKRESRYAGVDAN